MESNRRTSAGSRSCSTSTSRAGAALALRRMLAMRLLAAVRLAASGSSRKALSALSRASKSSGEAGRAASTASNISVVTGARARRLRTIQVVGAQPLHEEVVDLGGRIRRRGGGRGGLACRRRSSIRTRGRRAQPLDVGTHGGERLADVCLQVQVQALLDEDALHAESRRGAGRTDPWCPWASRRWRRFRPACRACRRWRARARVRVVGSSSPAPRGR